MTILCIHLPYSLALVNIARVSGNKSVGKYTTITPRNAEKKKIIQKCHLHVTIADREISYPPHKPQCDQYCSVVTVLKKTKIFTKYFFESAIFNFQANERVNERARARACPH